MKTAYLVAGLGFGDEGKGATVHYLVEKHKAGLVVRYNGGSQAEHNVVTKDGKHHTFSQFGSGTLSGARTHLSRFMLVNPMSMMHEAEHLYEIGVRNVWERTTVEDKAVIITPFQAAVNRLVEKARGDKAHGTCGLGIGQTRSDHLKYGDKVLFAGDLQDEEVTKQKLRFIQSACYQVAGFDATSDDPDIEVLENPDAIDWAWKFYKEWPAKVVSDGYLSSLFDKDYDVVFEGAQGVLLDEKFGFAPHNTWSDITFNNANELLAKADFDGEVVRVGVIRSYFTRHGAGPFPTEIPAMNYPELHNNNEGWQGAFRQGSFDFNLARYALLAIGGVDIIALNHLDYRSPMGFVNEVMNRMLVDKMILGYGPTPENKRELKLNVNFNFTEGFRYENRRPA
jgi:adenylosuccinate synthase